jgi:alkylation response protein AidB-like acyl-CoA dehydrogenase
MNFALSDDYLLLRDTARSFLAKEIDLSPLLVPRSTVQRARYKENWRKMVELGWPGLIVPEEFGGSGMTAIDLSIVAGEIGRSLAPSPLLGSWAGALALMKGGSIEQQQRVLPDIASGKLRLALAGHNNDGNADGLISDCAVQRRGGEFTITGAK